VISEHKTGLSCAISKALPFRQKDLTSAPHANTLLEYSYPFMSQETAEIHFKREEKGPGVCFCFEGF